MYGNNNFGAGYPHYQNQSYYGNAGNSYYTAPQQNQVNTNKLYANGIEDVRCRPLPVNSDYLFLDNDKPLVYRKTTDSTGKMSVQVFKIIPYEEEQKPAAQVDMSDYVLRSDFDEIKKEISQLRESIKSKTSKTKGGINESIE